MRLDALALLILVGCGHTEQAAKPATTAPASAAVTLSMAMPAGEAGEKLKAAAKQMDAGQIAEAVATLEALHREQPLSAPIIHELGLAYRLLKRPDKAVALWMPLRAALPVDTIAGLASALDEAGRSSEAEVVLREEITHHPSSGILRSELATTLVAQGRRDEALALYEKSIEVDPPFRASYLHAAEILSTSKSCGMALLYAETFRVLEPTGSRSTAASELMVRVCKSAVTLDITGGGAGKAKVSLAPNSIDASEVKGGELPIVNTFELAFGVGLVIAHMDGFSLATLHKARRSYLDNLNGKLKDSALAAMRITRWLRALDAAGHLEAYDYWLYSAAMPDEAMAWLKSHKAQADAMSEYFASHPLFP